MNAYDPRECACQFTGTFEPWSSHHGGLRLFNFSVIIIIIIVPCLGRTTRPSSASPLSRKRKKSKKIRFIDYLQVRCKCWKSGSSLRTRPSGAPTTYSPLVEHAWFWLSKLSERHVLGASRQAARQPIREVWETAPICPKNQLLLMSLLVLYCRKEGSRSASAQSGGSNKGG